LKSAPVQAAHVTAWSEDHYLGAQYRRLAARRGKQRAAVARLILVIALHLLWDGTAYGDRGAEYFDQRNQAQLQRLELLGYTMSLAPKMPDSRYFWGSLRGSTPSIRREGLDYTQSILYRGIRPWMTEATGTGPTRLQDPAWHTLGSLPALQRRAANSASSLDLRTGVCQRRFDRIKDINRDIPVDS
jgi:hypothetical protein